jgi:hypothetical protein
MNLLEQMHRRSAIAATLALTSCGGHIVKAQPAQTHEGKQLLLAIKRIIDEDLIDQPEKISEILGIQIQDYRGDKEDIRPVSMIGKITRSDRAAWMQAASKKSIQPQRVDFGKTIFSLFGLRLPEVHLISDELVIDIFGSKFRLSSEFVRPHYHARDDLSKMKGKYPGETMIFNLGTVRSYRFLVSFDWNSHARSFTISTDNKE